MRLSEMDMIDIYPECCPRSSMRCFQCLIEGKVQCRDAYFLPNRALTSPKVILDTYTGKIIISKILDNPSTLV